MLITTSVAPKVLILNKMGTMSALYGSLLLNMVEIRIVILNCDTSYSFVDQRLHFSNVYETVWALTKGGSLVLVHMIILQISKV
jgi:hypothetical protein